MWPHSSPSQTRELGELDRTNERIIQDLQAQRARIMIDREKDRTAALGRAEVNVVQAEQASASNLVVFPTVKCHSSALKSSECVFVFQVVIEVV